MGAFASCPGCDARVGGATSTCPLCGFPLLEERVAPRRIALGVAALAVAAAGAALTLPAALTPASTPISGAQAEGLLAARYPRLREAPDAVIACPRGEIAPGEEARCWILARVGQQRAATVRLSPRGNLVEIDD
jgi:hypothetical protein